MKTKELIRQLQELDPSGEEECCVGNVDIIYVDRLPAYYDGRLQVLQRDTTRGGFNITGVDFRSAGIKLNIVPYSCRDAIYDNADMTTTGSISGYYLEQIEKWRADSRRLDEEYEDRRSKLDAAPK